VTTDEVIDTIAQIEAQRQALEKESGLGAASSVAAERVTRFLEKPRTQNGGTGQRSLNQ